MTQPSANRAYDPSEAEDYRQQAYYFLEKSQEYLAEGDLHQASEKGWGAAAWMAKAVAVTQDWEYERHEQFNVVLRNARNATGDDRLPALRGAANELHGNFYTRKRFLDTQDIGQSLDGMADLLEILESLTRSGT